jgi:hypothetical protein
MFEIEMLTCISVKNFYFQTFYFQIFIFKHCPMCIRVEHPTIHTCDGSKANGKKLVWSTGTMQPFFYFFEIGILNYERAKF